MGETKKKMIEVAEYVLPKFEVTIDTPKDQIYKDGKIRATIRSKYVNKMKSFKCIFDSFYVFF